MPAHDARRERAFVPAVRPDRGTDTHSGSVQPVPATCYVSRTQYGSARPSQPVPRLLHEIPDLRIHGVALMQLAVTDAGGLVVGRAPRELRAVLRIDHLVARRPPGGVAWCTPALVE